MNVRRRNEIEKEKETTTIHGKKVVNKRATPNWTNVVYTFFIVLLKVKLYIKCEVAIYEV